MFLLVVQAHPLFKLVSSACKLLSSFSTQGRLVVKLQDLILNAVPLIGVYMSHLTATIPSIFVFSTKHHDGSHKNFLSD